MVRSLPIIGVRSLFGEPDTLISRVRNTQRDSLEQLLPFSDASGTIARDVSVWGRDGAYPAAGVTYSQPAPDVTGASVALDPAAGSTYINVYDAAIKDVPAGGQWSALVAVKKDAWGAADGYWLNLEGDSSNRLILGEAGADLRFFIRLTATSKTVDITTPTGLDWYVALVVVDQPANTAKLFINGYLVHTHTLTSVWDVTKPLASGTTVVGASDKVGNDEHDGNAYSYALWSTALTDEEAAYVTASYTASAYVDVPAGNNVNSGLTAAAAVADLVTAFSRLIPMGGNVYTDAPFANPITAESAWAQPGLVDVQGLSGSTWYMDGSTTYTAGWADETGGVWSRALAADPKTVAVSTIVAANGYYTTLTVNTGSPTTPSAGEYGHDTGTLYVHLPGSASANANTIKVPNATRMIVGSVGDVTLRNGWFEFGASHNILQTAGTVTAHQCTSLYSGGNGFANATTGHAAANNCLGAVNANDGFNAAGTGTMALNGCTGEFNVDEGASPHNTSTINADACTFNDNGAAGFAAVNDSTGNISGGTISRDNGTANKGAEERGGFVFADGSGGSITDSSALDNTGEGLYVVTTGTVVLTDVTSTGNSVADNIP